MMAESKEQESKSAEHVYPYPKSAKVQATLDKLAYVSLRSNPGSNKVAYPNPLAFNFFGDDEFISMDEQDIIVVCQAIAVCLAYNYGRVHVISTTFADV